MLTTDELLQRLRERGIRNVEMARVLSLPDSRIAELYAGNRSLKLDEAAKLVAAFGLEDDHQNSDPVSLSKKVAANVQRLREAAHLSRPELGLRCRPSTSGSQIERLEKGQRGLTLDWVERVAAGLKAHPLELITGSPVGTDGMSKDVAVEVSQALATVVLGGSEPDQAVVKKLAIFLHELADLFARHPEARQRVEIVRPVIDLIARRSATSDRAE